MPVVELLSRWPWNPVVRGFLQNLHEIQVLLFGAGMAGGFLSLAKQTGTDEAVLRSTSKMLNGLPAVKKYKLYFGF